MSGRELRQGEFLRAGQIRRRGDVERDEIGRVGQLLEAVKGGVAVLVDAEEDDFAA